jgi:hypothetical protein
VMNRGIGKGVRAAVTSIASVIAQTVGPFLTFRIRTKPPVPHWTVQGPEVFTPRLEEPALKWQAQPPQTTEWEGTW